MKSRYKKTLISSALFSVFLQPLMPALCAQEYPALHENLSSSKNYELVKVIDGHINGLFFNEQTQQIIVDADKTLWKINQQGVVIDKMAKLQRFFASGYAFNLESYNDWIHTGDTYNKKYQSHIDATQHNLEELIALFDSAEVVEFSTYKGKSYAYLYTKDGARLADITGRDNLINNRCEIYERRFDDINWKDVCFENYPRNKNLIIIDNSLTNYSSPLTPENNNEVLQAVKFKKRQYHLEEGVSGQLLSLALWPLLKGLPGKMPGRFWYGDAYFNLLHQQETLKFKAFSNNADDAINYWNLSVYQPPTEQKNDIKLLKIGYFNNQHLEQGVALNEQYSKDIGLYLIRKKGINPEAIQQSRKAKWTITYSGMPSSKTVTGYIYFKGNGHAEKAFSAGIRTTSPVYELPSIIAMEWFNQDSKKPFKLQVNDKRTVTFQRENKDTQVGLSIHFDQTELNDAFHQLASTSTRKNKDIVVNIQVQFNKLDENKAQLTVMLKAGQQQIELQQQHYSFRNVKGKSQSSTSTNQLKVLYNNAINNGSLEKVLLHIDELARQPDYIEKWLAYDVYILTMLLNHYNLQGDFARSKRVGLYYAKHQQQLVPLLDDDNSAHINHYVIISQSLVASLKLNDLGYQQQIVKMLGNNFDINTITNPSLIYNLACFYAVKKEKDAMLAAIKQGRTMGKPASQFLADSDFKDYYADKDFLQALE